MLRSVLAVALVISVLTACGDDEDESPAAETVSSIDREVTADDIVAQLEEDGFTVDRGCVVSVLDEFTDDELQGIDARLARGDQPDEQDAVVDALLLCSTRSG